MSSKKISINCPQCEKKFFYYDSSFRPFCSERCKMIDLGHWFQESYKVPSIKPLDEGDLEQVLREKERENEN